MSEGKPSAIDLVTISIIKGLVENAQTNASKGVQEILNVSAKFLSKSTHESLEQFRELYFKESAELESRKEVACLASLFKRKL